MRNFLLLNSPIFWDSTTEKEQYLSPLGLGYIATSLSQSGIDVKLVDCTKNHLSAVEIVHMINSSQPDCLGINIFTQNYDIVKFIIESISFPCECYIGGQSVKSLYSEILQWNTQSILKIIIGEGELIIPALVLGTCTQFPEYSDSRKSVYRINQLSPYFPKNISDIYIDRKFLDEELLTNHYGDFEAAIVTSRGCYYDCAFCGGARSLNSDIPIRLRSEESIRAEIEEIISLYPQVQSIRILDDLFLRNTKSADEAINIFTTFPQLSWRGMIHALSLLHDKDKFFALKSSGCRELFMGIESGSETVRSQINKKGSSSDVIQAATNILESGIDLKGYFIYGFPGETKADFDRTFELAARIADIAQVTPGSFRTSVFQFRPYHGTKLYKLLFDGTDTRPHFQHNDSLDCFSGRSQFNFDSGNYSAETDENLHQYIVRTQEL